MLRGTNEQLDPNSKAATIRLGKDMQNLSGEDLEASNILNCICTSMYWFGNVLFLSGTYSMWFGYCHIHTTQSNKALGANHKARIFAFSFSYPLSPFTNYNIHHVVTAAVINNSRTQGYNVI